MVDIPKDELIELYVYKRLSSRKIGEIYNVNKSTVLRKLKKFDISRRKTSEALTKYKISKEVLKRLYIDEKIPMTKIAEMFGCSERTIANKLNQFNVPIRSKSEALQGKNCGRWNGGVRINRGYKYIYMPDHPHATIRQDVKNSRLIMEKHLNRYLKPEERVHHIDGNKLNDSIENLMLFSNASAHRKYHYDNDVKIDDGGRFMKWNKQFLECLE